MANLQKLAGMFKRNPKKAASGTAVTGFGAYNMFDGDEEIESPDEAIRKERAADPEISSKEKMKSAVAPTNVKEEVAPDIDTSYEVEDVEDFKSPDLPQQDLPSISDDIPESPKFDAPPETSNEMKAMIADLQIKNVAALEAYKKETNNIKSKKMWDGIIKSAGLILGGMYAMKHGLDVSGMEFSPSDFEDEYTAADKALKNSQALNTSAYNKQSDLAKMKRSEWSDTNTAKQMGYNASLAQENLKNQKLVQKLQVAAAKNAVDRFNISKAQADKNITLQEQRDAENVGYRDKQLDIQAGNIVAKQQSELAKSKEKDKGSAKEISTKVKADAKRKLEKYRDILIDPDKSEELRQNAILKMKEASSQLGIPKEAFVGTVKGWFSDSENMELGPKHAEQINKSISEFLQGNVEAQEESPNVNSQGKKKHTFKTSSGGLPTI